MTSRASGVLTRPLLALLVALGVFAGNAGATTVLTVGDDEPADFTSIQEAIDAALSTTGYRQIKIARGLYEESILIRSSTSLGSIDLMGGYDGSFSERSRSLDPAVTAIDGLGGRVVTVDCVAGSLRLEGLTLTGGGTRSDDDELLAGAGGGAMVNAAGTCRVWLENDRFYDNLAEQTGGDSPGAMGAGLAAFASVDSEIRVHGSRFEANRAASRAASGLAYGGGLAVSSIGSSRVEIVDNEVVGNFVESPFQASAAGLWVIVKEAGTVEIRDNHGIVGNVAQAPEILDAAAVVLSSRCELTSDFECDPFLHAFRNKVIDNRAEGDPEAFQLSIEALNFNTAFVSDTIVAGRWGSGAAVRASGLGSRVWATNLTIVGHPNRGIEVTAIPVPAAFSEAYLANTITWNNGTDRVVSGDVGLANNLPIGFDPRFRDASSHDYRLGVGSPATDRGTMTFRRPAWVWDVAGLQRVQGSSIDIGAHETQGESGVGGGLCDILDPLEVLTTVPACRCLVDASAREFRCTFLHPELIVTFATPWPLLPGQSFTGEWTLRPWSGLEGFYRLEAFLLPASGEKEFLGSPEGSKRLLDNKLIHGKLKMTAPNRPMPLRTQLRYQTMEAKGPREVSLDALLPVVELQEEP